MDVIILVLVVSTIICYVFAELFGSSRHIGKWWSLLLLLMGFIPGIIAIFLSPFAKDSPTQGKTFHKVLAWIFLIVGMLSLIRFNPISLSFIVISIYLFYLSKGLIVNENPKFYFKTFKNKIISRNHLEHTNNDLNVSDLENLFSSGILNEKEYNEKKLQIEEKDLNLKNIESLQKLYSAGLLNSEEYNQKRNLLIKGSTFPNKQKLNKESYFNPVAKITILLSAVFILFFILFQSFRDTINLNLFNTEQQIESKPYNDYIHNDVRVEIPEKIIPERVELPKITKYVVFSFKTKEAEIFHLEGSVSFLSGSYVEERKPFTSVVLKDNAYTSSIIEIVDYNENKLFVQKDIVRDELNDKLHRNDERVKFNLSSGRYQLSQFELMDRVNSVNSKVLSEKIHEFDTYKEASLWKTKNE